MVLIARSSRLRSIAVAKSGVSFICGSPVMSDAARGTSVRFRDSLPNQLCNVDSSRPIAERTREQVVRKPMVLRSGESKRAKPSRLTTALPLSSASRARRATMTRFLLPNILLTGQNALCRMGPPELKSKSAIRVQTVHRGTDWKHTVGIDRFLTSIWRKTQNEIELVPRFDSRFCRPYE